MPDDCIVSYELMDKLEKSGRSEIYDLYAQTSYLDNLGKHGTKGEVGQLAEYTEAPQYLGPSNDSIGIGGADYDLFS